VWVRVTVRVVG